MADVDWSNDGTLLLSGGFDHCVKEWDLAAGKVVHSYSELQGFIQAVRFNPAGLGILPCMLQEINRSMLKKISTCDTLCIRFHTMSCIVCQSS